MSRLIVTHVTHFAFSTQLFGAKIFVFVGYHQPPTLYLDPSRLFSYCVKLFVLEDRRNSLLRYVTGNVTRGHMGTPWSLSLTMDLVAGQHERTFIILYFYWTLSPVGRIHHGDI